jgi:HK97 family phage major capsid protein
MDNVLTAVYGRPWAILPERLEVIADVVERWSRGDKPSDEILALYAAQNRKPQMQRNGKVAVLPVYGVLAQRMNMMTEMSGGTSYELFGKQFQALVDDPEVSAIVLDVDSPGGDVAGVAEVAAQVHAARGSKPIVAVANPLIGSAAYYIASATDEIVAGTDTEIGSIGVFMVHTDRSAADAQAGITRTLIKAGKYKAEGIPIAPLTDDARAHLQSMVDDAYDQFVGAVAKHRGVSADAIRNGYGQGRTHYGARAVASGLADRVGTMASVLAELSGGQTRVVRLAAVEEAPKIAAVAESIPISACTTTMAIAGFTMEVKPVAYHPTPPPDPVAPQPTAPPTASAHPEAVSHPGTDVLVPAVPLGAAPTTPAPKAEEIPVSDNPTAAPGAAPTITVQDRAPERGKEIAALCQMARVPERTTDYILSDKSVDQVRAELHAYAASQMSAPVRPVQQVENYEDGKHRFSLGKAIIAAANNNWSEAGFEQSVSRDIERRIKSGGAGGATLRNDVQGTTFYFPTVRKLSDEEREARMQATSHSVSVASNGGNAVFTEYGGFIDLLRTRTAVLAMGATLYPGLVGNVAFPRQITAGTSLAVAELVGGSDVTESNTTLDQVTLSPKTIMARQRYSNQLLAQGVINIDTLIRNDLAAIQSRKLDLLALHGVGSSNEPTGLYAQSGVNSVTFAGGPTYAKMVDMESAIEAADADVGALGYLFTPEIKGKAKQVPIFTNTGVPIWTGSAVEGEVNGYRAMASNQLSKVLVSGTFSDCHGGIFGVWPELLIGEWGGMAITVDPYTLAGQDEVRIIARQFFDVGVRHGAAFTKAIQLRNA